MSWMGTEFNFRKNAAEAVRDIALRGAMRTATDMFTTKRTQATSSVPLEEWRDRASEIKVKVLQDLSGYLDQFAVNATAAGAVVHRARDAQAARDIIFNVLRDRKAKKIVKAKSMVTEEIHLNPYLESHGMEVVETDLGEYIVQLAGEPPSHILAPAIHKSRQQVGRLFADKLGVEYTDDPTILTQMARKALRTEFLSAHAGISGANFAISDSGSLVIFTNEGNGRMVTTLPPLHIAVLSIEKMLPGLMDLTTFIKLLPRSASGQGLSSYLSVITGTRKPHENTGAKELHIVLLDNGRSEILKGPYWEILKCIRCSACMNVCPVYRVIGGHAYRSTYPGPMGIILTILLNGMDAAHPLTDATTLCGACTEVCPVKVPLGKLLRLLRERRVEEGFTSQAERAGMAAFGLAAKHPSLFRGSQAMARLVWPFLSQVTDDKVVARMPKPAGSTFRKKIR
ncbi:MAG: iron-sulfur cluster-binding protein [Desulfomonile tiedjei]|nr:iron-sulfur cluster-binding protein [Desulfomonile tiedjei]